MDLADVQRCISSVYGKKDGILRRMSIRMPFYLSLRLRYVQCIVQASDPGTFALLWAVPI